jgi:hypothetical protein
MPPRRPSRPVDDEPTLTDGANLPEKIVGAETLDEVQAPYTFLEVEDDDSTVDEPTNYRGDRPPKPSSSRRLSPTLMKICKRRREQIGLTIPQLADLTGIDEEELQRFEATGGNHRLVYDHAVVLARALGLKAQELPGLRLVKEDKDPVLAAYDALVAAYTQGLVITFEGKSGERYGGDISRLGTTPQFALKIGDASLGSEWPKGALLGFITEDPRNNDVALIRQKRGKQVALRRLVEKSWAPLSRWQPPYSIADWVAFARLQVVLPRY